MDKPKRPVTAEELVNRISAQLSPGYYVRRLQGSDPPQYVVQYPERSSIDLIPELAAYARRCGCMADDEELAEDG